MNAETSIKPSLIGALAKALAKIEGAQKNAQNPHLKNTYADLSAVISAIKPIAEFGLWFRQVPKPNPDGAMIETFYIHESGEEMSAGETFVPAGKRDPQGFGSALTYCRRYALQTAFGIAPDDDDGEAASKGMRGSRNNEGQQRRSEQTEQRPQGEQHRQTGGGMPDAAWAKLAGLLRATSTQPSVLTDHYQVENLRLLTAPQYNEAVGRLKERLARMAKADTEQRNQQQESRPQSDNRQRSSSDDFSAAAADDCPF